MSGQKIAYRRVSSLLQNTARQLDGMTFDREFEEKASGRSADDRPKLQEMLAHIRAGDTVYCHSLDRLGRNLADLLKIVEQITAKGAVIRFEKENLIFGMKDDPFNTLMLQLLGSFSQFERALIRERQAEGIAIAQRNGKFKGRPRVLSPVQVSEARRRHDCGESYRDIAEEMGCSRQTLYVAVAALLEKEGQAAL